MIPKPLSFSVYGSVLKTIWIQMTTKAASSFHLWLKDISKLNSKLKKQHATSSASSEGMIYLLRYLCPHTVWQSGFFSVPTTFKWPVLMHFSHSLLLFMLWLICTLWMRHQHLIGKEHIYKIINPLRQYKWH